MKAQHNSGKVCSADLDLLDGGGLGVGHGAGVVCCVDGRETVAGLDTAPQPSAHFISAAPRPCTHQPPAASPEPRRGAGRVRYRLPAGADQYCALIGCGAVT